MEYNNRMTIRESLKNTYNYISFAFNYKKRKGGKCKKGKNGEKLNEKPLDVKFSNFIKMGKMGQKRSSAHYLNFLQRRSKLKPTVYLFCCC
jgi:hypothetical protein